jgi:hypothetical protein
MSWLRMHEADNGRQHRPKVPSNDLSTRRLNIDYPSNRQGSLCRYVCLGLKMLSHRLHLEYPKALLWFPFLCRVVKMNIVFDHLATKKSSEQSLVD